PTAGFILSLISTMFILMNLIFYAFLITQYLHFGGKIVSEMFVTHFSNLFILLFIIGSTCVILMFLGSYELYRGKKVRGGILVIVGSTLSLFIGGGFLVGFILGIIGGAFGLADL
ncbi:MAG: hypothetical protein NZ895_04115, partial [Archaeoglobaceae archaeon]|nr:hypothetical protein [Archaeoglobaceae archaeon]